MKKKYLIILTYLILLFNTNLFSEEENKVLKIGLIAPLTGEFAELGNSLLYSSQLALDEIGDKNVFVVPRDTGHNDKEKLNNAIKDIKSKGVKIILGPINNEDFKVVKKFSDLIFISPSNISPKFTDNIISIGVSLESQIESIENFIKKTKRKKTIIMFPKNKYSSLIDSKIDNINIANKFHKKREKK